VEQTDGTTPAPFPERATLIALGVLLAASTASLARVFKDETWVLPVWAGMALVLLASAVMRRVRLPQGLSVLLCLAAFPVAASWLIFRGTLWAGLLPTRSSFVALGRAMKDGMSHAATEIAPVAVTPRFLVLAVAGAWLVALAADVMTFRGRQPYLALVPAGAMFLIPTVISSGPRHADQLLAFLIGASAVLLMDGQIQRARWGHKVAARRPAGLPGLERRNPKALGWAMAAVAAVVSLTLAGFLPGYGSPGWAGNGNIGPETRYVMNPLVSIRPRLVSANTNELFRVRSNVPSYWRLTSLDQFDGIIWSAPTILTTSRDRVRKRTLPSPYARGISGARASINQEFRVGDLSTLWLPLAFPPTKVDVKGDYRLDRGTATVFSVVENTSKGMSYRAVSQRVTPDTAGLRAALPAGSGLSRYLTLPASLPKRIPQIAAEKTRGSTTDYERALAIQNYLRSFVYDVDTDFGAQSHSGTTLLNFLTKVKRGYCEQFAAAMAVMLRSVGVPSRVAVGFTVGEQLGPQTYRIRARHAHAWPEAYFTGYGWVAFEPTPRLDSTLIPEYAPPPGGLVPEPSPDNSETPSPDPTDRSQAKDKSTEEQPKTGGSRGLPRIQPWMLALLALALLAGAVPGAKAIREAVRGHVAGRTTPNERVRLAHAGVCDRATDLGCVPFVAETPLEFAARATARFGLARPSLARLTDLHVRAIYAPAALSAAEAQDARQAARDVKREMDLKVGSRRRLAAAFNLRSLLPRRPERSRTRPDQPG